MERKFVNQRESKQSDTSGENRGAARGLWRLWLRRHVFSIGSATRVQLLSYALVVLVALLLIWYFKSARHRGQSTVDSATLSTQQANSGAEAVGQTVSDLAPTAVYAHNLLLHKGPDFRIYVRWLSGHLVRTRRNVNPSFDDP